MYQFFVLANTHLAQNARARVTRILGFDSTSQKGCGVHVFEPPNGLWDAESFLSR